MIQIQSSSGRWAPLVARIEAFLAADTIALHVGGHAVTGFRSPDSPALWIRDHADILRGGVYTTPDVWSAVEAFARAQGRDGRVFDFVTTQPTPTARENWETWVRVPVEMADHIESCVETVREPDPDQPDDEDAYIFADRQRFPLQRRDA